MWTYIKHNEEGERVADESILPPVGSVFLAFDTFRWKVQVGYREHIGCLSLLTPNVDDDCNVVAWAPLTEAGAPDETEIRKHCAKTWHQAINANYAADGLPLIRG